MIFIIFCRYEQKSYKGTICDVSSSCPRKYKHTISMSSYKTHVYDIRMHISYTLHEHTSITHKTNPPNRLSNTKFTGFYAYCYVFRNFLSLLRRLLIFRISRMVNLSNSPNRVSCTSLSKLPIGTFYLPIPRTL